MNDRDRLIELITNADTYDSYECKLCTKKDTSCIRCGAEKLTDHLLANGVIVTMCYIGQPIWHVYERVYAGTVEIEEGKISMIQQKADKSWKFRITVNSSVWDFTPDKIGTIYFLTKEEAERALKEREQNG